MGRGKKSVYSINREHLRSSPYQNNPVFSYTTKKGEREGEGEGEKGVREGGRGREREGSER